MSRDQAPFHAAIGGVTTAPRSRAMAAVEPTESWSDTAINHWIDDQIESIEVDAAAETAVMDWDDASEGTPPPPFVDEEELPTVGDVEEIPELPQDIWFDIIERQLGTFELARCKLPEYFDQVRTVKRCFLVKNPSPLDPEFDQASEPGGMQVSHLEARLMTCKEHYWNQDRWWVQDAYMSRSDERNATNFTKCENHYREKFVRGWLWTEQAWNRAPGTNYNRRIWNRIALALPRRLIELGDRYRALRHTPPDAYRTRFSETHIEAEIHRRLEREKTLRSPIFDVVNASLVNKTTREYLTDDVCEKLWSSIRDARLWHETLLAHPHLAQFILPSAKALEPRPSWTVMDVETVSGPYTRAMQMLFYHVRQFMEINEQIHSYPYLDETTALEWERIIKLLLRTIITTGVVESYSTTYSFRVRDVSLRMTVRQKLHLLSNEKCHGIGCDRQTGWDDVYLEWGTRLCPGCYKKKFIRLDHSDPLLQKYFCAPPQVILDRFKGDEWSTISLKVPRSIRVPDKQTLSIVDRTGGVPRAEVEAFDSLYQAKLRLRTMARSKTRARGYQRSSKTVLERWAARQEKYDMMVDVLGLPSSECERSETFQKLMNSRKGSISRNFFILRHRRNIVRELGRL